jgi:hypothetical protein
MSPEVHHSDPLGTARVQEPYAGMGVCASLDLPLVTRAVHPPLDALLWGVVRGTRCRVDDFAVCRNGTESAVSYALIEGAAIRAAQLTAARLSLIRLSSLAASALPVPGGHAVSESIREPPRKMRAEALHARERRMTEKADVLPGVGPIATTEHSPSHLPSLRQSSLKFKTGCCPPFGATFKARLSGVERRPCYIGGGGAG